ncbi:DUF4251 domain-containing protein [Flavobacteriaceae bacterium TP-CH-4]|uniref:DUF4251 domain-containing protein n=1 Tax=Pelagihabitans pacificus TaxID=2696054 RepID=A0A967ATA8_9FLAO|nr:DUF4251 domain-containing protein [Pelagihabitans pacificus]NHF59903.1 DUF4251 domain-containing protein [Pelagihabitans pacificus]
MIRLLFMVLLGVLSSTHAQTKSQKSGHRFAQTLHLVESGSFLFEANTVTPRTSTSFSLANLDNYLAIDEGHVKARLPYFGVERFPDYNGPRSIQIDGVWQSHSLKIKEKKKRLVLKFVVKDETGQHTVIMMINGSGWTNVAVRSLSRPSISYYGKIKPLSEKTQVSVE